MQPWFQAVPAAAGLFPRLTCFTAPHRCHGHSSALFRRQRSALLCRMRQHLPPSTVLILCDGPVPQAPARRRCCRSFHLCCTPGPCPPVCFPARSQHAGHVVTLLLVPCLLTSPLLPAAPSVTAQLVLLPPVHLRLHILACNVRVELTSTVTQSCMRAMKKILCEGFGRQSYWHAIHGRTALRLVRQGIFPHAYAPRQHMRLKSKGSSLSFCKRHVLGRTDAWVDG